MLQSEILYINLEEEEEQYEHHIMIYIRKVDTKSNYLKNKNDVSCVY